MKGFILLLTLVSSAFAAQDLCATAVIAPGSTFKFADDPSDCAAYLFCNFNGVNLTSVHQGKCATGNFKALTATCEETSFACTAACEFNPVGTTIRIAVADDVTCRKFQSCSGTTISTNIFNCTAPSVFNRNYGLCTSPSIAPCSSGESSAGCEVGKDGFVNDVSGCKKYFFCKDGEQTNEVCPNNLHFNPNGNFCDKPENLNPPCTDTLVMPFGPEIPKPPHFNRMGQRI